MIKKQNVKGKKVKVTFVLPDTHPHGRVSVVGDFNNWVPGADLLKKRANKTYSASIELPANQTYRFRYLGEDGAWINDETADAFDQEDCVINT